MEDTQHDKPSESFLREVNAVSEAEKTSQELVEQAKKKAEQAISDAQAEADSILARASKEAVAKKNSIIAKSRQETDKKVKKIIEGANGRAQELSSRRLSSQAAKNLSDSLL